MSHEMPPITPRVMTIGLFAYSVTPNLVFVRVPTERGRWILTDRCVVEVACHYCHAVIGEPCRRHYDSGIKHHISTHIRRRSDARSLNQGNYRSGQPYPKLRLRPDEIEAPYREPGEEARA